MEATPFDRMKTLKKKGFCTKCLVPGLKRNPAHDCDSQYVCQNTYTDRRGKVKRCINHVLVCGFHAKEKNNIELFQKYKNENILKNQSKLENYSKNVSISLLANVGCWRAEGEYSDQGKSKQSELEKPEKLECYFYV